MENKSWIWKIVHPSKEDSILVVSMDKETAMDFIENMYKAINNQENEMVTYSLNMVGFLSMYDRKSTPKTN